MYIICWFNIYVIVLAIHVTRQENHFLRQEAVVSFSNLYMLGNCLLIYFLLFVIYQLLIVMYGTLKLIFLFLIYLLLIICFYCHSFYIASCNRSCSSMFNSRFLCLPVFLVLNKITYVYIQLFQRSPYVQLSKYPINKM